MNRLALSAFFALVLPGCPLTDEYYVAENEGQANTVVNPRCGDGVIDNAEACDGADLAGQSCQGLGLGAGTLSCKPDCRYDVSGCVAPMAACGDGVAQGVEACDGSDLLSQTCSSLGLDQGTLGCTASCAFDFSGCVPTPAVCGNGVAEAAEGCDGADLRGQTCSAVGLTGGTLACTSACAFDFTGCVARTPVCGDAIADSPEACDGVDLGGESCETLGFGAGTLGCTSSCGFDTSGCGAAPGCGGNTGVVCCERTGPEVCDGVSNDCDAEVDEGDVCPAAGRGATYAGHVYILYLYAGRSDEGGWNQQQQGSWGGMAGSQADYGEARTTCRAAGALLGLGVQLDLARIESADENEFARVWIAESTSEEGMIWMGANDLQVEGRWMWGQDAGAIQFFTAAQRGGGGTPVMGRFNDFTDGRPNSANAVDEDCGAFDSEFDWHWNDLDCGVPRLGMLCEQLD
jgi:hypothetical protein